MPLSVCMKVLVHHRDGLARLAYLFQWARVPHPLARRLTVVGNLVAKQGVRCVSAFGRKIACGSIHQLYTVILSDHHDWIGHAINDRLLKRMR
jgi:hypothetical protein